MTAHGKAWKTVTGNTMGEYISVMADSSETIPDSPVAQPNFSNVYYAKDWFQPPSPAKDAVNHRIVIALAAAVLGSNSSSASNWGRAGGDDMGDEICDEGSTSLFVDWECGARRTAARGRVDTGRGQDMDDRLKSRAQAMASPGDVWLYLCALITVSCTNFVTVPRIIRRCGY